MYPRTKSRAKRIPLERERERERESPLHPLRFARVRPNRLRALRSVRCSSESGLRRLSLWGNRTPKQGRVSLSHDATREQQRSPFRSVLLFFFFFFFFVVEERQERTVLFFRVFFWEFASFASFASSGARSPPRALLFVPRERRALRGEWEREQERQEQEQQQQQRQHQRERTTNATTVSHGRDVQRRHREVRENEPGGWDVRGASEIRPDAEVGYEQSDQHGPGVCVVDEREKKSKERGNFSPGEVYRVQRGFIEMGREFSHVYARYVFRLQRL